MEKKSKEEVICSENSLKVSGDEQDKTDIIRKQINNGKDRRKRRNKKAKDSNTGQVDESVPRNCANKDTSCKIQTAETSSLHSSKSETSICSSENISDQLVIKLRIEEEILWCIQDISKKLQIKKLDQKTEAKYQSALKTLENKSAPLPKKRQLMHSLCGNYKLKMNEQTEPVFPGKVIASGITNTGKFIAFAKKEKPSSWISEFNSVEKFTFSFPNP